MKLLKREEKRKFPRLAQHFPVRLKIINQENKIKSFRSHYKVYSRNISGGGIAVELAQQRLRGFFDSVSKKVGFEFSLPETTLSIAGTAEVAWAVSTHSKSRRFGLKFVEVDDALKDTLIHYISERVKMKKKPLKNLLNNLDNFFYRRIVRPLLFTSRLGRKSMFGYADSGLNFDHIYRNEAKGYMRFGRLIDKILLNLPSAKATRHRKAKIIEIQKTEIKKNIFFGRKTRIVDLASGPGRYLIEAITDENKNHVEALCLDIDKRNLEFGKKLAGEKPLLFKRANALRLGHFKKLSEKTAWIPNLVLCSGLYEYLNDAEVKKSINDIFSSLNKEGLFVFVTQMDSPSRKLIEKLGKVKGGKSWVLFYRKPDTLKSWMAEAGFKEINAEIDPWKMYVLYSGRKS